MNILEFIFQILLGELIVVIAGVIFANYILTFIERWHFGGWTVRVSRNGQTLLTRDISPRKLREIQEEPADLAVYLKGILSPYAWITCDHITVGQEVGLLTIDNTNHQYHINLDKNPVQEKP